jgi:uncharacterized coiled-coil DUF342 family protein
MGEVGMTLNAQATTTSLSDKLFQLERQIETLSRRTQNQRETIEELNAITEENQRKLAERDAKIRELEEALESMKAMVQDQVQEAAQSQKVQQENEKLVLEIGRLRQALQGFEEMKRENQELDASLHLLEKKLIQMHEEAGKAQPAPVTSTSDPDQIISTLEASMEKQARELDAALDEIQKLKAREQELLNRVAQLEMEQPVDGPGESADVRTITQRLEMMELERDELRDRARGLQQKVDTLKPLLERAKTEIIARDEEITRLRTTITDA